MIFFDVLYSFNILKWFSEIFKIPSMDDPDNEDQISWLIVVNDLESKKEVFGAIFLLFFILLIFLMSKSLILKIFDLQLSHKLLSLNE